LNKPWSPPSVIGRSRATGTDMGLEFQQPRACRQSLPVFSSFTCCGFRVTRQTGVQASPVPEDGEELEARTGEALPGIPDASPNRQMVFRYHPTRFASWMSPASPEDARKKKESNPQALARRPASNRFGTPVPPSSLEEGRGIEPPGVTPARFSGPVCRPRRYLPYPSLPGLTRLSESFWWPGLTSARCRDRAGTWVRRPCRRRRHAPCAECGSLG
jgi:hypothetical protein